MRTQHSVILVHLLYIIDAHKVWLQPPHTLCAFFRYFDFC